MPLPSESEPDTLHADIEAAFDAPAVETTNDSGSADTARGGGDAVTTAGAAGKTGASADDKGAPKVDAKGKLHGNDGKFIPKDTPADNTAGKGAAAATTTAASAAAPTTISPSTDAAKASTDAPSTAPDAPPVGWTAEGKAEWSTLSNAVKASVLKREVEIDSGGRQWSEEKRQLEETIAPVAAAASRRGMTAAQGIQVLVQAQNELDANPGPAIERIARSYGLSVTVNGNAPQGATPSNGQPAADGSSRIETPPYRDPRVDAIQARFDAQDRRETEMTVQRVTAFATDPAHPHFDAVSPELMAMLPLLKSSNPTATPEQLLQDAYDRAVWANPDTRRAVEAQRLADADAQRRQTNSAEVAKARLASSSIRPGAPPGLPASGPKDSIREELLAAWQ